MCTRKIWKRAIQKSFLADDGESKLGAQQYQMPVGGMKHRTSIKEPDYWPIKSGLCDKKDTNVKRQIVQEGQKCGTLISKVTMIYSVSWSDWTTESLGKKLCKEPVTDPRWSQRSFTMKKKTGQLLLGATSLAGRDGLYIISI